MPKSERLAQLEKHQRTLAERIPEMIESGAFSSLKNSLFICTAASRHLKSEGHDITPEVIRKYVREHHPDHFRTSGVGIRTHMSDGNKERWSNLTPEQRHMATQKLRDGRDEASRQKNIEAARKEDNPMKAKFSDDEIRYIRETLKNKRMSQYELSKEMGCSRSIILHAWLRHTYKHVE